VVDPIVVVMLALGGGLFLFVIALGLFYPGSGADQVDWKPTRSAEVEYQNEIDDLEQMQAAVNAKRRARGAADLTHADVQAQVAADLRERVEQADDVLIEEDIEEMLAVKNARRAKKGLPPLTRADYEREVLGG
jgi:hypothetical protein